MILFGSVCFFLFCDVVSCDVVCRGLFCFVYFCSGSKVDWGEEAAVGAADALFLGHLWVPVAAAAVVAVIQET